MDTGSFGAVHTSGTPLSPILPQVSRGISSRVMGRRVARDILRDPRGAAPLPREVDLALSVSRARETLLEPVDSSRKH